MNPPHAHEALPAWEPGTTYVVGHLRPDTDAVASAVGYAWLLAREGQSRVAAARAGVLSTQTAFALQHFGLEPPLALTSVSPTLGHAAEPTAALAPDRPLSEAVAELLAGRRVVPVADADGRVRGVITAAVLAALLAGAGDPRAGLARPCGELAGAAPTLSASERVRDVLPDLLRGDADDFLVTSPDGRYLGVATRAGLLQPPRARLVLVDHNELSQAVAGAEEAEIVGVLDHHRLGNPPTPLPIRFVVEPVGSTSTLVAEACRRGGHEPPAPVAGALLAGILSDTLLFRSPTTTSREHEAAAWLAGLAGVEITGFGEDLLRAGAGLRGRSAAEVLEADRKTYTAGPAGEVRFSVAQVEVGTVDEVAECRDALLEGLDSLREREGLILAALMVTDVVAARSRLLCRGERRLLAAMPFPRRGDGEWDLGPVVSRKKQLVPLLLSLVESAAP